MSTSNDTVKLYRKRYYPEEVIYLKDDIILMENEHVLVTKWNTLKPRCDIAHGISAYYHKEGIKVSKIFNSCHELVYWYCDIIEAEYDSAANSWLFTDLLLDVVVYPDNSVKVLDLDEIGMMLETGSLDIKKASKALKTADRLLSDIYAGSFDKYQAIVDQMDQP